MEPRVSYLIAAQSQGWSFLTPSKYLTRAMTKEVKEAGARILKSHLLTLNIYSI